MGQQQYGGPTAGGNIQGVQPQQQPITVRIRRCRCRRGLGALVHVVQRPDGEVPRRKFSKAMSC